MKRKFVFYELAIFTAFLSIAISPELLLPTHDAISESFHVNFESELKNSLLLYILGMLIGEIVFGYFTDVYGRKLILIFNLVLFIIGCFVCYLSSSYEIFLIGRIIQGISAAGQKISRRATIRDLFSGNDTAKFASLVTLFTFGTPFIAPLVGELISNHSSWRDVFIFQLIVFLIAIFWVVTRESETLKREDKNENGIAILWNVFKLFLINKKTMSYTFIAGLMFGYQLSFQSQSPPIFSENFGITDEYAFYIGLISMAFPIAIFMNGFFVNRLGMINLVKYSLMVMFTITLMALIFNYLLSAFSYFPFFFFVMFTHMLCVGFVFGNIIALILEPLGRVAGFGASVSSAISTVVALVYSYASTSIYALDFNYLLYGALFCSFLSLILSMFSTHVKVIDISYNI